MSNCSGEMKDLRDLCDERVGIVVAAGPSLEKNWDVLMGIDREKFFVIALGTILKKFVHDGFHPDYVITAGEVPQARKFLECLDRERSQLILSTTSHPSLANLHDEPWWYNNFNVRIKDRRSQAEFPDVVDIDSHSPTLAFHAIEAALIIEPCELAVVGLDLCIEDPERHHAFDSVKIGSSDYPDKVPSLNIMRESYARSLKGAEEWGEMNPGKVVNCTEGGAVQVFPKMSLAEWTGQ